MRLKSLLRTALPLLVGMALAVPRADSAHLHVCLDGQESPIGFHSPDGGNHHDDESGTEHQDRDVELNSELLGKSPSKSFDTGLPTTVPVFVAFQTSGDAPSSTVETVILPTRRFVLPPLRGPPA